MNRIKSCDKSLARNKIPRHIVVKSFMTNIKRKS